MRISPTNQAAFALVLMLVGLVPFGLSEASYWWWRVNLPIRNNVGLSDAMIIAAVRQLSYIASFLVAGVGLLWSFFLMRLMRRHPGELRALLFGVAAFTSLALVIPLAWWAYAMVAA